MNKHLHLEENIMNNYLRKSLLLLLTLSFVVNSIAEVIDYGKGKVSVSDQNTKFGPSAGYNKTASAEDNLNSLEKKTKELTNAKKELKKRKRKTSYKKKNERAKIQEKIDKITKELKKVFRDHEREEKIKKSRRRPKKGPKRRKFDIDERKASLDKLDKLEKERLKRLKKAKKKAKKVSMLENLGELKIGDTMTEVIATHNDILENQIKVGEIEKEMNEEQCEEVNEYNAEICYELNSNYAEASSNLKHKKGKLKDLTQIVPPLALTGGIYFLWDALNEKQENHKKLVDSSNDLEMCLEDCEELQKAHEYTKKMISEIDDLHENALSEIQNEVKVLNLEEEVHLEIVVPNYLSKNQHIPFGHSKNLPIAIGISTNNNLDVIKAANLIINEQAVPLTWYSEAGVFVGDYKVKQKKEDFQGAVVIEGINGKLFTQKISGSIYTEKPEVKIQAIDGSMFKRGKFKVELIGEFDRIEISGKNVKTQVIQFGEIKKHHKMIVKTKSKGPASLKIVATRKTKTIELPEFDGEVLSTDEDGIILRESDYFSPTLLEDGKAKAKDMGWCCEGKDKNGICEGCMLGKRSYKTCKRLAKLPGFQIKAFLKADDLSCVKL